ncbi:MAG: DNA gyrase inhibitor YacG [Novosphingobium sp.]
MSTSPKRKCPICGKPRSVEHSPFCSTRCRDRDLVRWLDDGYAIPGPAVDPERHPDPGDDEPDAP